MPRWVNTGKALTALRRRFRTNVDPSEMLTGMLPTIQADRHWMNDTLDVFGLLCQAQVTGVATGAAGGLSACQLTAPPGVECLVHQVEFHVQAVDNVNDAFDRTFHIFSPLEGYDPVAIDPGAFFAWLQMAAQDGTTSLQGLTFATGGSALTHQTVTLNAVPIITFGPLVRTTQSFVR
ncbi:MAG: hypothetical protein V3T07_09720, partial [Myxococcota bacterium]